MTSIVDDLKGREWHIDWEGDFSLLSVFLPIPPALFEQTFSIPYPTFLLLHKRGYSRGLFDAKEYERVGQFLATRMRDDDFLMPFCTHFKAVADSATKVLSTLPEQLLHNFDPVQQFHQEYLIYQQASKLAYNYEAAHDRNQHIVSALEDVRKYSEKFFKLSTQALDALAAFIAQKNPDYSSDLIAVLSDEEVRTYKSTGVLPNTSELGRRHEGCGVYWGDWKASGPIFISGEEVVEIEKSWSQGSTEVVVKGNVAYPGIVTGKCRVIFNYKDANIEEGEVLVTGMTDPNFVPLMKKAAAIVTDGGGLLCHAAIVAREMKKPCIIGTKFATQVFKDGDMVEVDANAGVVRKV